MNAPRKRGRPADRSNERRELLMDAALHSFVERGFYGTSIPEIAARADVAAGTIYHYFDSKEALVNELYRMWKTRVAQRVFTAFPAGAPPREQFRVMWQVMMDFATNEPTAFAFIELHNHASYLDAESLAIDRSIKDFGAGIIQQAQRAGLVKAIDVRVLMELIFGAFIGMIRARWEGRITVDDDVARGAEQACWDAIIVHPT
jgi:TetR/AcrR family transcriptional regulator, repressor of fatR-cypB operon